jgi:hypothetical protein
MTDTKEYETCREMGKRATKTDLKSHHNIREDTCDQTVPLIWRFACEDVCQSDQQRGRREGIYEVPLSVIHHMTQSANECRGVSLGQPLTVSCHNR